MKKMMFRFIACVVAVPLAAYVLEGVQVVDYQYALYVGVGLGLIYLIIRPIAKLLTGAFSLLTLGLVGIVVDSWLVMLAAEVFTEFKVEDFKWALFTALIVNALRYIAGMLAKKR